MSQETAGTSAGAAAEATELDEIVAQWHRERPDIDATVMAVCGAIWRAAERLRQGVLENLGDHDLDFAGFDVLMTLRRNGKEAVLSPTALAKDMMLSSAAMTNRLDRLEKRGLIERKQDPQDRRALRVKLTAAGHDLIDGIVVSHVDNERRMLEYLSAEEQAQLRGLLGRVAPDQ